MCNRGPAWLWQRRQRNNAHHRWSLIKGGAQRGMRSGGPAVPSSMWTLPRRRKQHLCQNETWKRSELSRLTSKHAILALQRTHASGLIRYRQRARWHWAWMARWCFPVYLDHLTNEVLGRSMRSLCLSSRVHGFRETCTLCVIDC